MFLLYQVFATLLLCAQMNSASAPRAPDCLKIHEFLPSRQLLDNPLSAWLVACAIAAAVIATAWVGRFLGTRALKD
jgi:hypothetical protein